jgi:hypothetical protein
VSRSRALAEPGARWRKASEGIVEPAVGRAADLAGLGLMRQEGQHDLGFCTGDGHPHASVDSDAEREVPGRTAHDVETVQILPTPSVSVSGGQEEEHLLALAEPDARDLDGARRGAEERLHRRLEPEHLFERRTRE